MQVNQKLKDAVFKDMPNYEYDLLKAVYIYIKLCKILSYDEEFYAANQKGEAATFHENVEHISEITPENNAVVCYEFAYIYALMLNEIGIPTEIVRTDNKTDIYGQGHTFVRFTLEGTTYNADSTQSVFTGDLFGAKLNLPIKGLYTDNNDDISTFFNIVYSDMKLPVASDERDNPDYIENTLNHYRSLTKNIKEITLKERVDTIIAKANSSHLKGFDRITYLNYLLHFLIPYKDKYNVKMTFIRDNTTDRITARAIIQIYEDYTDEVGDYHYYSYGSDQELKEIPLDELQSMFDDHELEYIKEDDDHKIIGVRTK